MQLSFRQLFERKYTEFVVVTLVIVSEHFRVRLLNLRGFIFCCYSYALNIVDFATTYSPRSNASCKNNLLDHYTDLQRELYLNYLGQILQKDN